VPMHQVPWSDAVR